MKKVMKISLCFCLFPLLCSCGKVGPDEYFDDDSNAPVKAYDIGGTDAGKFAIVYNAYEDEDVARTYANTLKSYMRAYFNQKLKVNSTNNKETANEIVIGQAESRSEVKELLSAMTEEFDWRVRCTAGKLLIVGKNTWGLKKAVDTVMDEYLAKDRPIPAGLDLRGNVRGHFIFPFNSPDCNLRILDWNVWSYDKSSIPEAWAALGDDPRNAHRSKEYAAAILGYMPDVCAFQEYTSAMSGQLLPKLSSAGYRLAWTATSPWNNTPLMYNANTVDLVTCDWHSYTPETYNNGGSKSYTAAVFRHKASGKHFIVIGTHLWWRSDAEVYGSDNARISQITEVRDKAEQLLKTYDAPVFVMGDMNCDLRSNPMKVLLDAGYKACSQTATFYRDGSRGYHACDADNGWGPLTDTSGDGGLTAIDQMFSYHLPDDSFVREYRIIKTLFTLKLSDHCGRYIDVVL